MPTEIGGEKVYTILETAKALDVTAQTIRYYIKQGKLKGEKIGAVYFITESNILEYIKPYLHKHYITEVENNSGKQ